MIELNSREFHHKYVSSFISGLENMEVSTPTEKLSYKEGLNLSSTILREARANKKKIMIIGNGGSAAIASHMTVDFMKQAKIRTINFNDSSVLTALANDISYDEVFSHPIEKFADEGDILIGISSSGNSENIVRGAQMAAKFGCKVITCSGFNEDNRLRKLGDLNFYVPTQSYGIAETLHQLITHEIMDVFLYCENDIDIFYRNQVQNPS